MSIIIDFLARAKLTGIEVTNTLGQNTEHKKLLSEAAMQNLSASIFPFTSAQTLRLLIAYHGYTTAIPDYIYFDASGVYAITNTVN